MQTIYRMDIHIIYRNIYVILYYICHTLIYCTIGARTIKCLKVSKDINLENMQKNMQKYVEIVIFWQWNRVKRSNRIKPPKTWENLFSTCAKFTRNLDPWNIWPSMSWGTGQREKETTVTRSANSEKQESIKNGGLNCFQYSSVISGIASSTCSKFCTWTHISASRLSSQGLQAESTSKHETRICSKLLTLISFFSVSIFVQLQETWYIISAVQLPQEYILAVPCQPLTHPEKIRSKMQRSGQRQSLCFSE